MFCFHFLCKIVTRAHAIQADENHNIIDAEVKTYLCALCVGQVHIEAVLAILLASFVGFIVAVTSSALLIEYANWKRRAAAAPNEHNDATFHEQFPAPQAGQTSIVPSAPSGDLGLRPPAHNVENPPVELQGSVLIENPLNGQNTNQATVM